MGSLLKPDVTCSELGRGVGLMSSVNHMTRREARIAPDSGGPHQRSLDHGQGARIDDADLLQHCRAGDEIAWVMLVERYERLVFSVAMRNGLTREDSADVAQVTFVALLDNIDDLRDDHQLPYWLMTVARRHAWRTRRRRERELGFDSLEPPSARNEIANIDRHIDIYLALDQLGHPCRELLIGLYFDPEKPSYAQIGRQLGRAIGGLGPLRARCLQRLRHLLGEDYLNGP